MSIQTIQTFFRSLTASSRHRQSARRPPASRLRLEPLEDRRLLSLTPGVAGPGGNVPAVADFNVDGRLDLATVNYGSNYVSVLLGNANGTFQSPLNSSTGAASYALAAGDFNADGQPDLAIASYDEVKVLLGQGDGAFQAPVSVARVQEVQSLSVGDFNQDGSLDLGLVGFSRVGGGYYSYYQPYVQVLLGNGQGAFPTKNTTSLNGYSSAQLCGAVADFNGDGASDLAVSVGDANAAFVLLSDGLGNLQSPLALNTGSFPSAIVAGDVDGDGDADLATANSSGASVSVLLGNGQGGFQPAQQYNAGNGPRSLQLGDFDRDGNLDVVTSNVNSQDVTVLIGRGDGSFATPQISAAGSSHLWIVAGDFNADGWLDAVTNSLVLINDHNWQPPDSPRVAVSDVTVTEGNTGSLNASFTVSLSAASSLPITVPFSTADDTATAGSDYLAASGVLTFAPGGPLSKTVNVPVLGDRLAEPSYVWLAERFFVNLGTPSNAILADNQGVATILDNEPQITGNEISITEGNTGTRTANFSFTMATASDGPVTVAWSTMDASATAGSDYAATSGVLTFNPGASRTQTASVPVLGDRLAENLEESFYVFLGNGESGYATILDDEPLISVSDAFVIEGNSGTVDAAFTVSLSLAYDVPVTVNFSTAEGDTRWYYGDPYYGYYPPPPAATVGSDFQSSSGTLTFAAGQTQKTVNVAVLGDQVAEPYYEYFSLDFANASSNAALADDHGLATVVDNGPVASVDVGTSVLEGNSGTRPAVFTVRLAASSSAPVMVAWSTADNSARAGSDYQAAAGMLTFNPGVVTQKVSVLVQGDRLGEPSESFSLNLGNGAGTTGLILDDEPYVSISDRVVNEGNTGTTSAGFTVSLSQPYDQPVSVNFSTFEGDLDFPGSFWGPYGYYYYAPPPAATAGADFQGQNGTITFASGETAKPIAVVVNGDRLIEESEFFSVALLNASPNATVGDAHGLGTIADDEPTASIDYGTTVVEGNTGTTSALFTVRLSHASDLALSVSFATQDGSGWSGGATAGSDYLPATGTVNFAAGETIKTFTVPIVGDLLVEFNEPLYVSLTGSDAARFLTTWVPGTIIDDDQPATKFFVVDASSDKTFEYDPDGQSVESYGLRSGNNDPRGAASSAAGDRVWVIDNDDYVYVYDAAGSTLGYWKAKGLSTPEGIASDGTDIWIVDRGRDRVYRYAGAASRLSGSANATSSFALNSGNRDAKGIETDGTHLWVVNDSSTNKVFKYTLSGSLVGSWTISGSNTRPTGITLDPSNPSDIWIVDSGRDQVFQYSGAANRTSGSQAADLVFALAAGNTNPQGIADPPPVAQVSSLSEQSVQAVQIPGLVKSAWNAEQQPIMASLSRDETLLILSQRPLASASTNAPTFARSENDSETINGEKNHDYFRRKALHAYDAVFADAEKLGDMLNDNWH